MHGYQVIQELADRSGGAWTPGPGSVYPTLQAMEEQGLVSGEQDGSRRVFSLTDTGRTAAGSAGENREPMPWEQIARVIRPAPDPAPFDRRPLRRERPDRAHRHR